MEDRATKVTHVISREISKEELVELAPFTVLWPTILPDGYAPGRIMEMSTSTTQSSNTGQFILEFINRQFDFLHIWQTNRPKSVKYYDYGGQKATVGNLSLPSGDVPLYAEGELRFARFQFGELNIELIFRGINTTEVESVVSSLTV